MSTETISYGIESHLQSFESLQIWHGDSESDLHNLVATINTLIFLYGVAKEEIETITRENEQLRMSDAGEVALYKHEAAQLREELSTLKTIVVQTPDGPRPESEDDVMHRFLGMQKQLDEKQLELQFANEKLENMQKQFASAVAHQRHHTADLQKKVKEISKENQANVFAVDFFRSQLSESKRQVIGNAEVLTDVTNSMWKYPGRQLLPVAFECFRISCKLIASENKLNAKQETPSSILEPQATNVSTFQFAEMRAKFIDLSMKTVSSHILIHVFTNWRIGCQFAARGREISNLQIAEKKHERLLSKLSLEQGPRSALAFAFSLWIHFFFTTRLEDRQCSVQKFANAAQSGTGQRRQMVARLEDNLKKRCLHELLYLVLGCWQHVSSNGKLQAEAESLRDHGKIVEAKLSTMKNGVGEFLFARSLRNALEADTLMLWRQCCESAKAEAISKALQSQEKKHDRMLSKLSLEQGPRSALAFSFNLWIHFFFTARLEDKQCSVQNFANAAESATGKRRDMIARLEDNLVKRCRLEILSLVLGCWRIASSTSKLQAEMDSLRNLSKHVEDTKGNMMKDQDDEISMISEAKSLEGKSKDTTRPSVVDLQSERTQQDDFGLQNEQKRDPLQSETGHVNCAGHGQYQKEQAERTSVAEHRQTIEQKKRGDEEAGSTGAEFAVMLKTKQKRIDEQEVIITDLKWRIAKHLFKRNGEDAVGAQVLESWRKYCKIKKGQRILQKQNRKVKAGEGRKQKMTDRLGESMVKTQRLEVLSSSLSYWRVALKVIQLEEEMETLRRKRRSSLRIEDTGISSEQLERGTSCPAVSNDGTDSSFLGLSQLERSAHSTGEIC